MPIIHKDSLSERTEKEHIQQLANQNSPRK